MKKIFLLSMTFLLLCACSDDNESQVKSEKVQVYAPDVVSLVKSMNMDRPANTYKYPITPDDEGWAMLPSGDAMVETLQIPQDILELMSTEAIIQSICEYPLLLNVFHRSQYQSDFTGVSGNNACRELLSRDDAGSRLLMRLKLLKIEKMDHIYDPVYPRILELLSMQPEILSQLNGEDKVQLINTVLEKEDIIGNSSKLTDTYSEITWILIAKALVAADYTPFVQAVDTDESLQVFIKGLPSVTYTGEYGTDAISTQILPYVQEFLKNK